ncbi:hypothetical protein WN48_02696 [Eufriesea mexicana]|uniref:LisH domain-containing protein n=1 Tax=Eufriesea mexicana TaxID=516756 RepID=A0A310SP67_9HYME|nr:hypothetical protein WN48_02696 [Eufriesea mexicana]
METLLPSEIARLVFGYLESQKCMEAAKIFLETSPHLQECRTVISNGKRFSTKVNKMALTDVIEKFFAINSVGKILMTVKFIVHERLNKIADCEQLKQCGDLLEQLKFLMEETRGQRFVVNINVPSQTNSQICNNSPIISCSTRKRRNSTSDRERCKRTKIISNISQQLASSVVQIPSFDSIEATPLKSLPGYIDISEQSKSITNIKEKKCSNSVQYQGSDENIQNIQDVVINQTCADNSIKDLCMFDKCTTATSTEELLSYSCAEVQTTPYDTPESESESNDEPIENLSLLTKELLNRTELQERIAENINKAILPTDMSSKDEGLNDSVIGEANTSIMIELNNAIKSIVEATESDPVFEKFLEEIIGPNTETDISFDEDTETKSETKFCNRVQEERLDVIPNYYNSPESVVLDVKPPTELNIINVPLKHKLHSSSRQQNPQNEVEQHDQEKEYNMLEDQNAAAVLNDPNIITMLQNNDMEAKIKQSSVKRLRLTKLAKQEKSEGSMNNYTSEQKVMTIPTLIMCSKEEINNILSTNSCPPTCSVTSTTNSRFIPIVPKESATNKTKNFAEALYLTTVNVAQKVTETSTKTLLDSTDMPTINIEDNISLSASGLSPYIKFNYSTGNQSQPNIDLISVVQNVKIASLKTNNNVNDRHFLTSKKTDCDIINKRTPKSLLKSRSKNYRLSLSTPRRRNSHIRALDFNTPIKATTTSDKIVGENESVHFSSGSAKLVKSVCRNSLFKSPPFTSTAIATHKVKTPLKFCRPCKLPIVTRSPIPKLMGEWEKYNGLGVTISDVPSGSNISISSENKATKTQTKPLQVTKETWDADLRKALHIINDDHERTEMPISNRKIHCAKVGKSSVEPSVKKDKANLRVLKGKNKNITTKQDGTVKNRRNNRTIGERNAIESSIIKSIDHKVTEVDKDFLVTYVNHNTIVNNFFNERKDDINSQTYIINKCKDVIEQKNIKHQLTLAKNNCLYNNTTITDNLPFEKKNTKKYVQLKTLKTNLNKCGRIEKKPHIENKVISVDAMQRSEFIKTSMDMQHLLQIPNFIDLETPRKFENPSSVPPTPRLLSPSSNTTPLIKYSEDFGKMRSFINTPEFPTTPCIALTPKISEQTTIDNMKKETFNSCSPYYKPTFEQNECKTLSKLDDNILKSTTLSSQCTKQCIPHNVISCTNAYQTCVSTKLEITQFEVIKENLPKEEAIKELKISNNSRDSTYYAKMDYIEGDTNKNNTNKSAYVKETINDRTECSTISGNNSPKLQVKPTNILPTEATIIALRKCESSPSKIFSVLKDEDFTSDMKETPAKNETSLNEEHISEAPNSSKTGVENLTNLSSKISAVMSSGDQKLLKSNKNLFIENLVTKKLKQKPKIVNIQHLRSGSLITSKPNKSVRHSSIMQKRQRSLTMDKKFVVQLEAKRQRMIAKFREIPKTNFTRKKFQQGRIIFKGSKMYNLEESKQKDNNDKSIQNNALKLEIANNVFVNTKDDTKKIIELTVKNIKSDVEINVNQQLNMSRLENKTFNLKTVQNKEIIRLDVPSNLEMKQTQAKINVEYKQCEDNITNEIILHENEFSIIKDVEYDSNEKGAYKLKEYPNCNDTKGILLKSKVDQVKRDLFSDDEETLKEEEVLNVIEFSANQENNIVSTPMFDTVKNTVIENINMKNPKSLSRVLQCLQLVPRFKHDYIVESQCMKYNRKIDLNVTIPNSVEYHFRYDDNAFLKKRRQRYSNHELEFQINIILNDQNYDERIKVMTATDYEEIFNLSPKPKKRLGSRKSPIKYENSCETLNKSSNTLTIKNMHDKPLATSSPLYKLSMCTVKKVAIKTATINEKNNEVQHESKKRLKVDKIREFDKANISIAKIPKGKMSERKESKQIEQRQYTTDPQTLLSNLDLDKFLTSVHGPA